MSPVKLISRVGKEFEIPDAVFYGSPVAMRFVENGRIRTGYSNEILEMVVQYCWRKTTATEGDDSVDKLGAEIIDAVKDNNSSLIDITMAASYLNIKDLRVLACGALAEKHGRTLEQMLGNFRMQEIFGQERNEEDEYELSAEWEDPASTEEEEVGSTPMMDTPKGQEEEYIP